MLPPAVSSCARIALLAVLLTANAVSTSTRAAEPYGEPESPKISPASDEAIKAMSAFKLPANIKATLFAAEPQVANPVALTVDDHGRVWVCESFRQSKGVEDNRGHGHWLDDDLAAQTVADRAAYYQKHLKEKAIEYTKHDDRIRLLEDRGHTGHADFDSVFADHFNHLVEGTAAGILVHGDDIFVTNIPNLWRLRDPQHTGKATERTVLHTGYGVRTAFRGHDLHGLVIGPDGKLYFSCGDRGFNVTQGDKHLVNTESGGVLRCNLDGSDLEVFYTGLRNPQKLAFDDFGNLFTDDNNSDSGDQARWSYLVEGGDSGWRMAYQYLGDRGPFNREKIWHPFHAGQPAYIVPPIANIASGPSGLAYYPGTGLAEGYQGTFFLVDFHGAPGGSGVMSVKLKPKGAFFEVAEQKMWWNNVLATDVVFGPDGYLYITDWVTGWNGEGKGRIYRAIDPAKASDPLVLEVQRLLGEGFAQRSPDELAKLLAHADRRVRQEAQFALVEKNGLAQFIAAAQPQANQFARLHAIWGLGQLGRRDAGPSVAALLPLLEDKDPEIVAQAVHVLGDLHAEKASEKCVSLLAHENLRVRFFAATTLGKLGSGEALVPLIKMLAENDDRDPIVRHGGVLGLVGTKNVAALVGATAKHPSVPVRIAAVVALRRLGSPEVATFLGDSDERVVLEAARAVYDIPLAAALPQLAALISHPTQSDPLLRRVLATHYRLGQPENARALAEFAGQTNSPEAMRIEALQLLAAWEKPSSHDRVLGMWRPIAPRDAKPASDAIRASLPRLLSGSEKVRTEAAKVAAQYGLKEIVPELQAAWRDSSRPGPQRAEALLALAALKAPDLEGATKTALADANSAVRVAGRQLLAKSKPTEALPLLEKALAEGDQLERQSALDLLGKTTQSGTNEVLSRALDKLLAGAFPEDARLELLEASRTRNSREIQDKVKQYEVARPKTDPLATYAETLAGGNSERGALVFFEKTDVSCVRCHKVNGRGGDVGPDLSHVASQKDKDRRYLLESIVEPNKVIAKGFETVVISTAEGKVISGILKQETDKELTLITPDAQLVTIPKSSVDRRTSGKSAMPEDVIKKLSLRELRDVLEFLSGLK